MKQDGAVVLVDKKAQLTLLGTEMDYQVQEYLSQCLLFTLFYIIKQHQKDLPFSSVDISSPT